MCKSLLTFQSKNLSKTHWLCDLNDKLNHFTPEAIAIDKYKCLALDRVKSASITLRRERVKDCYSSTIDF